MPLALSTFLMVLLAAESPTLHPEARRLPFEHQGPFVTTQDGGILCIDAQRAWRSRDEGKTWAESPLFTESGKYAVSNERALLRTREGVLVSAWMNGVERRQPKNWRWGEADVSWREFVLPTYVCRSLDDGRTWEPPVKLAEPWCGCIHSLIQLKSGRLVLIGQEIIPEWRHATVTFASDDLGKTWQRGELLDYGVGAHDHAGSIEGTVIERADGEMYLLLRTESGWLWEATSRDGLKWDGLRQSKIPAVTCCAQMTRLADGRIVLLWNAPPRHAPTNRSSRVELSLAWSTDDARTWSEPVVVAANYAAGGRVSYPYCYERRPGELWITTMQGGLRMAVAIDQLAKGGEGIPVHRPPATVEPKPGGICMFGDSTTAFRPGSIDKVYSVRVAEALQGIGSTLTVHNAGVGGNSTREAKQRLERDVLRHRPRVVVMQFGINDSAIDVWRKPPATEPRVPLDEFTKNLRSMIETIRQQNAQVILMTANPLRWTAQLKQLYGHPPYLVDAEDGFESPTLLPYNEAMRKLGAEMKVPVIDLHAAYPEFAKRNQTTIDGLLLDGMHPNDRGHALAAELLLPAIRAAVR